MEHKILYCRCAFAQVVPQATKDAVLEQLCQSGAAFETVADLCEMAARKDARLAELLAGSGPVKIAACYPRAVKWLFHNAGVPFPGEDSPGCPKVEVLNMRDSTAEAVCDALLGQPES